MGSIRNQTCVCGMFQLKIPSPMSGKCIEHLVIVIVHTPYVRGRDIIFDAMNYMGIDI